MNYIHEWLHQTITKGILPLCLLRDTTIYSALFDHEVLASDIVRRCPILFRLASPRLRDMHEFALLGISGFADNISAVSPRLRGTDTFISEAYRINRKFAWYAYEPVRSDVVFWEHVRGEGKFTPDDYPDEDDNGNPIHTLSQQLPLPSFEQVRYVGALDADMLILDAGMTTMLCSKEFTDLAVKHCPRLYHALPEHIQHSYILLSSIEGTQLWA
jgi:hypothetical protein